MIEENPRETHADKRVNHRRVGNQFAQLGVEGGNLAAVPHEMRQDFNRKEIQDILSQELSPEETYLLIKDNPNLTSDDISGIMSSLGAANNTTSEYKEVRTKWEQLRTQEKYTEYMNIKDNPNLTSDDISGILSSLGAANNTTSEYKEVQAKWKELNTKEGVEVTT